MNGREGRLALLIVLLISTLQSIPVFQVPTVGDTLIHYQFIRCFAEGLAAGEWYPRWCFNTDAGLGAPFFVFYFPLPYYVTSFFGWLLPAGASTHTAFTCAVWCALVLGGLTAWQWLKDMAGSRLALLLLPLFLLLPYRSELIYFRTAFAELFGIALMPMVLLAVRQGTREGRLPVWRLSFWLFLMMLCHVPTVLITAIGCGMYLLIAAERKPRVLLQFAGSLAWALAATAFYVVPSLLYKPYTIMDVIAPMLWSNDFVKPSNFLPSTQGRLLRIGLFLLGIILLLGVRLWRKRALPEPFLRREFVAWTVVAVVSLFMMFPISAPLWNILRLIGVQQFPWRMQLLVSCFLIYLAAMNLRYAPSTRLMRTWKGDTAALIALFSIISYFLMTLPVEQDNPIFDKAINAQYSMIQEYRAPGTSPDFSKPEYILQRYDQLVENPASIPKAQVIRGHAQIEVVQWGVRGIVLNMTATEESLVRLDHRYFPIWKVMEPADDSIVIGPEDGTGQMMLYMPPGRYHVVLKQNIAFLDPLKIRPAQLLSLVAISLWMIAGMIRLQRAVA